MFKGAKRNVVLKISFTILAAIKSTQQRRGCKYVLEGLICTRKQWWSSAIWWFKIRVDDGSYWIRVEFEKRWLSFGKLTTLSCAPLWFANANHLNRSSPRNDLQFEKKKQDNESLFVCISKLMGSVWAQHVMVVGTEWRSGWERDLHKINFCSK